MAINKNDLEKFLTTEQKAQAQAIEEKIDASLETDWSPGSTANVALDHYPSQRIRDHLKIIYKNAGWSIEFHSDQRDGDWVAIK